MSPTPEPWGFRIAYGSLMALSWLFDLLTFVPSYLYWYPSIRFQKRVKARPANGHPGSNWIFGNSPLIKYMDDKSQTLDTAFERLADRYEDQHCLGTREIFSEEEETQSNGKKFKKLVMGEYKWKTYKQVFREVDCFGKGLQQLGVQPRQNVLIFSETREEFLISLQACFRYNNPVVTLYATLGDDAIVHGINEAEISVIITSASLLPKLQSVQSKIQKVCNIICFEDQLKKPSDNVTFKKIKVHTFKSIMQKGQTVDDAYRVYPAPEDLAVIMYTSGSTGKPKGVMISHRNLVSITAGAVNRISNFGSGDTYISFLPLAHVLELAVELSILTFGARIGYSSALTLTDMSSKVKKGTKGDVTVLKPTLMAAVPLIMERLYKGVMDKVKEETALKRLLFHFAYNYKLRQVEWGFGTPILDRVVFAKLKQSLGGQIRVLFSGGALLSANAQRFMSTCFCCPSVQGYGLTETCGGGAIGEVGDNRTNHVGPPLICNYIRLENWVEGNYRVTDKPCPRGEVIIGGPNVTMGYYKNPALTSTVYRDNNGVREFHTGDIGEMQPDGTLKIIDRKKDLVKIQTGEYISLQKVEIALKKSPYIENICVYGDGEFDYVIGLVVPYKKAVEEMALKCGIGTSWEEICASREIERNIILSIQQVASEAKLQKWEVPKKIKLCKETWTPDTGLVTDAFKLKRKPLQDFYDTTIRRLYGK